MLLDLIRAEWLCVYSSEEPINTEEQFMMLSCFIHNTVNVASIKNSNVPIKEEEEKEEESEAAIWCKQFWFQNIF